MLRRAIWVVFPVGALACSEGTLSVRERPSAALPGKVAIGASPKVIVLAGRDPLTGRFSFRMGSRLTCDSQPPIPASVSGDVLREWLVGASVSGPFVVTKRTEDVVLTVSAAESHRFVKCRILKADGTSGEFVTLFESAPVQVEDTPTETKSFSASLAQGETKTFRLRPLEHYSDADGDVVRQVEVRDWPLATPAPRFVCDAQGVCEAQWEAPADAPASVSARYVVYSFGDTPSAESPFTLSIAQGNAPVLAKSLSIAGSCASSAAQGVSWSCQVSASGDEAEGTKWSLAEDNSCSFLTLSTAVGTSVVVSGTPSHAAVGSCVLKLRAEQATEATLVKSLSTDITVCDVPPSLEPKT